MTANDPVCISCRKPKGTLQCGICHEPVCKGCAFFLDEEAFFFKSEVTENLRHLHYCQNCASAEVEPAQSEYNDTLTRARDAYVFFTTQKKPIPVLKKAKHTIKVAGSRDRNDTILKLAFQSCENGFNAIINTEIICQKVRNEGYQKSAWSGEALPAEIDVVRFEKRNDEDGG